ncbi:hypothetical protein FACS1894188_01300 [Clostridia bacterium]|nr:hypothetical protein FACS1894188_01300 [Clostridia bacterium]
MQAFELSSRGEIDIKRMSSGKLQKWYIPEKRLFVKLSTQDGYGGYMSDSLSEVAISALCGFLGFSQDEYVKYEFCEVSIDGTTPVIGCACANFLKDGEQYLPLGKLINPSLYFELTRTSGVEQAYKRLVENLRGYGISDSERVLERMFLLDFLTLNKDRHFDNLGVIRGLDETFGMAPIFDNGGGFWGDMIIDDTEVSYLVENSVSKPFCVKFDDTARLINPENIADLRIDNADFEKYINELENAELVNPQKTEKIKEILKNRLDRLKTLGIG